MRITPARMLAAAGVAGLGAAAASAAYVIVRGGTGMLYAAGICLFAFLGTLAIVAGRTEEMSEPEAVAAPRSPRWRRKKHIIAELESDLVATGAELEEHRRALANLATQLSRETEAALSNAERLEQRIRELETERDALVELVAAERERFERTLDELGELVAVSPDTAAELERELEALIAR